MKKQFVITVWSSEPNLDLTPEQMQHEIYETISNLDTVEVMEIQNGEQKISQEKYKQIREYLIMLKDELENHADSVNGKLKQFEQLFF